MIDSISIQDRQHIMKMLSSMNPNNTVSLSFEHFNSGVTARIPEGIDMYSAIAIQRISDNDYMISMKSDERVEKYLLAAQNQLTMDSTMFREFVDPSTELFDDLHPLQADLLGSSEIMAIGFPNLDDPEEFAELAEIAQAEYKLPFIRKKHESALPFVSPLQLEDDIYVQNALDTVLSDYKGQFEKPCLAHLASYIEQPILASLSQGKSANSLKELSDMINENAAVFNPIIERRDTNLNRSVIGMSIKFATDQYLNREGNEVSKMDVAKKTLPMQTQLCKLMIAKSHDKERLRAQFLER